jgi:hypothetical protein
MTNGGNTYSKLKKVLAFQTGQVLAAPIIGHDAMFTLFSVYSFGASFQSQQYITTINFFSPTLS